MADAPTTPNSESPSGASPAAPTQPTGNPSVVPAAPSLLGGDTLAPAARAMPEGFEGGADAWAKLDDAGKTAITTAASEKATTESKARTDALAAAATPELKKAAYDALTPEEKTAAFKALKPEDAKALGIEDPAIPVYGDFKLPEGVTLDAEAMKSATDLFKEARIPQDQAQKFIDLAVSREQAAAQRGLQAYIDMQTKWHGEVMADPEIGGSKWEASKATADRLFDRLAIPGLKEALNITGAGNNPAVVKAFVRLGTMVSEDTLRTGRDGPSADGKSVADRLYGQPTN